MHATRKNQISILGLVARDEIQDDWRTSWMDIAEQIDCEFEGMKYAIDLESGTFSNPNNDTVFRISANMNALAMNLLSQRQ